MEISGWDIASVAAKALLYASTLGACGTVFFQIYADPLLTDFQRRNLRRLLTIQLMTAALFTLLRVLLLTGSMNGEFSGMFDREMASMVLEAGEGRSAFVRLAGLGLAACALLVNRRLRGVALPGALLAVSSFAFVGHVKALHPLLPAMIFSCVHLTGVSFWIGALIPLLWASRRDNHALGALAEKFGVWAMVAVSVLIIAGLALLLMLSLGRPEFWSSSYGLLIALKLLLVTLLLGAAGLNKLWLTPRLLSGDERAVTLLRWSIRFELLTAALILLVTASFTSLLGPPR